MREIKFRAWCEGKMIGPFKLSGINASEERVTTTDDTAHDLVLYKCELLQYTGLKDKNGVEIYEGDIVRTEQHFKPFVVKWEINVDWESCEEYIGYLNLESFMPEVIGNIHEHAHLLTSTAS